jgi:acetate kinase
MGIDINSDRNQANELLISTDQSTVDVHVIAAREDTSIIKEVSALL